MGAGRDMRRVRRFLTLTTKVGGKRRLSHRDCVENGDDSSSWVLGCVC